MSKINISPEEKIDKLKGFGFHNQSLLLWAILFIQPFY